MSSADNLHDAHLKIALAHAPDQDLQPNSQVRKAVLDYAKQATTPRQTWPSHLKNWLLKDHFANAQWAGATGLAAVFLVTVMLWREHPEDTVGISNAPAIFSDNSVISDNKEMYQTPAMTNNNIVLNQEVTPKQNESVSAKSAPAEVAAAAEGVASSYKKQAVTPVETPKTVINKPLEADKELKQSAQKNEEVTTAANMPTTQAAASTVAAAPPTTTIAADSTAKAASASEVAPSKPKPLARQTAQAEVSDMIENQSESIEKRSKIEAQIGNLNQIDNHALAKIIVQNGGQALAAADIQAVKYRLLKVVVHGENNTNECKPTKMQTENVDANTGWHIENIDICLATDKLMQEVALYNQAMNAWFLQQNAPKK